MNFDSFLINRRVLFLDKLKILHVLYIEIFWKDQVPKKFRPSEFQMGYPRELFLGEGGC